MSINKFQKILMHNLIINIKTQNIQKNQKNQKKIKNLKKFQNNLKTSK
jgi:hypothetical protein